MWSLRIIGAITLFVMLLNVGSCVYYGFIKKREVHREMQAYFQGREDSCQNHEEIKW